jgi:hypothetical protein
MQRGAEGWLQVVNLEGCERDLQYNNLSGGTERNHESYQSG